MYSSAEMEERQRVLNRFEREREKREAERQLKKLERERQRRKEEEVWEIERRKRERVCYYLSIIKRNVSNEELSNNQKTNWRIAYAKQCHCSKAQARQSKLCAFSNLQERYRKKETGQVQGF